MPDLLGVRCCDAVELRVAASIESPRFLERFASPSGRSTSPGTLNQNNPGAQHVDSTSARRIFRGDKLPRPPVRMDVGNSKPPKTAWNQTWRPRFQFGAWRQACWRNSSYRVSRPPRPRGRKCSLMPLRSQLAVFLHDKHTRTSDPLGNPREMKEPDSLGG